MNSHGALPIFRSIESSKTSKRPSQESSTRLDTWHEVGIQTTKLARAFDYSSKERKLLKQQSGDVTVVENGTSREKEDVLASDTSPDGADDLGDRGALSAATTTTSMTVLLCSKDNPLKFEVPLSRMSGRLLALARSSLETTTEIKFEESIGAVWSLTRFLHGDRHHPNGKARWELQCERMPALANVPWNAALVDGVKLAKTVIDADFELFVLELMKTLKV